MSIFSDPFLVFALGCAALAAAALLWFLVRRPALTRATKIVLLFGVGLLPIGTAATGNIAGYHATKTTKFCASSCHVMVPYGVDSWDHDSTSLASRHGRNDAFGDENCYTCHADYGMFGTITTKLGGLRHVYEYIFHFGSTPQQQFYEMVEIRNPFPNATCMRCHSTKGPAWSRIGDHASTLDRVRDGTLSCASEGCHGFAHPFSKAARRAAKLPVGGRP